MKSKDKIFESLKQLGLNNLEAEVYMHLLTNHPMTAYKVGKEINKPTANVYKAIESLSKKGAVIIEDNKNKHCKAVSSNEFINHYEKNILSKTKMVKSLLENMGKDYYDEKTYSIDSVPLVFERFRTMMQKAKVVAVIDAFPKALNQVVDSINMAIERGVKVYIQTYKPIDIPGADIAFTQIADKALSHWQSQQLNLVIDGEEYIVALMNKGLTEVKQASWSNNIYMSCIIHAGRMSEQTTMKIMSKMNSSDFEGDVKKIIENQKFFFNTDVPGFNKLFKTK